MSYLLGIPFVNRLDLLKRALDSVGENILRAVIINNSPDGGFRCEAARAVVKPLVALTATQSINAILGMAKSANCYYALFMHSDAEAVNGAVPKLLDSCAKQKGKWGVLFTNYDALCAFNMRAVEQVGLWDANFSGYFSDNDYYRRMRLAGWECRDTGIEVKHEGSATINADAKLAFLNRITFPLYRQYYIEKWGGDGGHETFQKPFNGVFENL